MVDFRANLRPRTLRKRMRFIDNEQLKNWRNLDLYTENRSILWGGEPGGALLLGGLRPEQFSLFLDLELSQVAKTLGLIPSESGTVEVLQKFWKFNDITGKTAPALLVYAELINSGYGRNIETAKKILANELQHIQWKIYASTVETNSIGTYRNFKETGISFFVIGAIARDIIMEIPNAHSGQLTYDLDIAGKQLGTMVECRKRARKA